MALTIAIEGKGVIANADALVNDTGGTGTGDWLFTGGGAAISLNPDVYIYGANSSGCKYPNKDGLVHFDIGVGNELDFTVGSGSEEGQFVWIWLNIQSKGQFDTLANSSFTIRLGSGTTINYMDFLIAGDDDANGWMGGWKLFVIDPMKTPSSSNGVLANIRASIRYIGVQINSDTTVGADSIFLDQIAVGKGLRVTGTSATGFKDLVDYCTDYANRAWGMWQERGGIYYTIGKTYIGDATSQSADVSFADSSRIIQYDTSQYYESGAWKTTLPTDASGIVIEDRVAWKTDFTDGVIVGTDNGRSGSVIVGNADQNIIMDLYGGNNAASKTLCYGTTFKDIKGAFNSGNDADHKFLGVNFLKCSQFDPVGSPVIRNCIFAETVDTDAALLWNENIDIEDCKFIASTLGAGIEMPSNVGTPYDYDDLLFSGNTHDVLNSSGNAITITKTGTSNPTTSEGAAVTFSGSVTITITVKDTDGNLLADVQTAVYKTADRAELMNEDTIAGVATEAYTGATPVGVEVRCRKGSHPGTKYKNFSSLQTVAAATGLTLAVTLEEDTYNNAVN